MTGVDLEAIARGLAAQISTQTGDQVNAYWFPLDNPRFPCVILRPASPFISYHETMSANGLTEINLDVEVYVSAISPESAASALYALLGVGTECSVFDAVEADRTWGGTVGFGWVSQVANPPQQMARDDKTVLWASMRAQALERKD